MDEFSEFIQVGTTRKPHGLKGEISIQLDYPLKDQNTIIETMFVGDKQNPLPYFVENLRAPEDNFLVVKFDEVTNRNEAEDIRNKPVFVSEEVFTNAFKESHESNQYDFIIGYQLENDSYEMIGEINDIFYLPEQNLAQVFYKTKEALIPINPETVIKIDKKAKTIIVKIPEGLLEINN